MKTTGKCEVCKCVTNPDLPFVDCPCGQRMCERCFDASAVHLKHMLDVLRGPPEHFVCPECGPHVAADEDGCCSMCGVECSTTKCDCSAVMRSLVGKLRDQLKEQSLRAERALYAQQRAESLRPEPHKRCGTCGYAHPANPETPKLIQCEDVHTVIAGGYTDIHPDDGYCYRWFPRLKQENNQE